MRSAEYFEIASDIHNNPISTINKVVKHQTLEEIEAPTDFAKIMCNETLTLKVAYSFVVCTKA